MRSANLVLSIFCTEPPPPPPKWATNLAWKCAKFSWGGKLEAFPVAVKVKSSWYYVADRSRRDLQRDAYDSDFDWTSASLPPGLDSPWPLGRLRVLLSYVRRRGTMPFEEIRQRLALGSLDGPCQRTRLARGSCKGKRSWLNTINNHTWWNHRLQMWISVSWLSHVCEHQLQKSKRSETSLSLNATKNLKFLACLWKMNICRCWRS